MDTDDLSAMAYECLVIAERTNHTITIQLGVMSKEHQSEDAYLLAIAEWAIETKRHARDFIEEWGLENELTSSLCRKCMNDLILHARSTLIVPISSRGQSA